MAHKWIRFTFSASSSLSWTADADYFVTGLHLHATATLSAMLTSNPNLTIAQLLTDVGVHYDVAAVIGNLANATAGGYLRGITGLKIPIVKDEVWTIVCTGAASVILQLEPINGT